MPPEIFTVLQLVIDTFGVWLFCSVIAVFILPLVIDRVVFYIPTLLHLRRKKEVLSRGVPLTFFEVLLWVGLVAGVYTAIYFISPDYFERITISPPALLAWTIGLGRMAYRFSHFDRTIKRQFYYNSYMRYITPEAYNAYRQFLEDLDELDMEEMADLLEDPDLPYMQRQSVMRRQREARMVLLMSSQGEPISTRTDTINPALIG